MVFYFNFSCFENVFTTADYSDYSDSEDYSVDSEFDSEVDVSTDYLSSESSSSCSSSSIESETEADAVQEGLPCKLRRTDAQADCSISEPLSAVLKPPRSS